MSAFHPTAISLNPPADDDPRAVALAAALNRNLGFKLTWNLPVALAVGIATAGLAPLVILLLRFRTFAVGEKFQLEHAIEWTPAPDGVRDKISSLGAKWPLSVVTGLAVACAALVTAVVHVAVRHREPLELWSLFAWGQFSTSATVYIALLIAGYAVLYAALRAHVRAVSGFRQALRGGGEAVTVSHGAAWLIVGVTLLLGGCLWGFAMMLAAGAHRRYINEVSGHVRAQIARHIEG